MTCTDATGNGDDDDDDERTGSYIFGPAADWTQVQARLSYLRLELLLPVRQQVDLHVRIRESVGVLGRQVQSFQDLHHQLLRTEKSDRMEMCVRALRRGL